jgi:PRTRC genetic system protein E
VALVKASARATKGGPVFIELMPLLAGRTVLITVAKVDAQTLRVNVIPTQAKADENPALSTSLTYSGSPEELDAELGKHLAGYVQTRTQTASTLAEAKATLEAVVPSITFFAISAAQPAFAM